MKSETLDFEIEYDNKSFQVSFETESRERNILMNVNYNGYSLDTSDIKPDHPELYRLIRNNMDKEGCLFWDNVKEDQQKIFDALPSKDTMKIKKAMKAMVALCLITFMCSCQATKVNMKGQRVETSAKKHWDHIHPNGGWAGNNYLYPNTSNK